MWVIGGHQQRSTDILIVVLVTGAAYHLTTPDIIQLQSNIRDALREKKWYFVGKIPRI